MPPPGLERRIAALRRRRVHDGLSPEGRATAQALGFNEGGADGPLGTRHVRILDGDYPPAWARVAYDL